MATPLTSASNDTYQVSLYKIAYNWWLLAVASGWNGSAPRPSDPPDYLVRLTVDYTAFLS